MTHMYVYKFYIRIIYIYTHILYVYIYIHVSHDISTTIVIEKEQVRSGVCPRGQLRKPGDNELLGP